MRKNLLLLIMFCLIATIGAKATATATISGNTLTIKTENSGEVASYLLGDGIGILNGTTDIKSLIIDGYINETDIQGVAAMPNLTSLDLSLAKIKKYTSWSEWNLVFPQNPNGMLNKYDNYLIKKLETIKFPKPTNTGIYEIPSGCMQKYNIQNVIIPCGYTKIGSQAFQLCNKLQILNIPEGVTEIGTEAFRNSIIQAIRLPKSLLTIGDNAFNTCGGLASITIPANVTSIGNNAFECCYGIRDVYVLGTTTIPTLGSKAFDQQTVEGCVGGYPTTSSASREDYWTSGHHYAVLHYPSSMESSYRDMKIINTYSIPGTDGIMTKYPNQDQAKALNTKYSSLTSWKEFTISQAIDGEIKPIPNIAASRWYTMCFDFDLTKDQIESAFGAGTEVCRFQGVSYTKDASNNLTATLDFTKDMYDATTEASKTITEAGHPYMIHPAAATPDNNADPIYYVMGIKKVTCSATGDNGEVFDNATSVKGYYPKDSYTFIGNLSANTTVPVGNYYLGLPSTNSDGTEDGWRRFFYNKTSTELVWKTYVATLQESGTVNYHASNPTAGAKTCVAFGNDAVIFTSDNSTTGIENTESENSNETSVKFADKVFSISGQLVRTGSSSLDGLAKGMYIVNGKKYIVK